jgi:hypothetical protein
LSLKTKVDGLWVVWPQNLLRRFLAVWLQNPLWWFLAVCDGLWVVLASKPAAMVSAGLASKPAVMVSAGLASKPAVTVFRFGS